MKKWIYYFCLIILLILISIIPTSAKEIRTCTRTVDNLKVRDEFILKNNLNDIMETPCVDDVDKVYDFADLLSDLEEEKLFEEVTEFINNSNYDLVLVTTAENPKSDAASYADDFYDYNYFGKNETRDGVLVLIDMATRELYISTTGYGIKMFDDIRIDDILDSGYDYITNEDYFNTFSFMIQKISYYYNLGFPESNNNLIIDESGHASYINYMPYPLIGFISIIVSTIVSIIFYNTSRLKLKVENTISYMKNKKINLVRDNLVNSVVTHTLRNTSTGSSGGSSGSGGSSFHTSSSGSSHGGGGRHF